MPKKADPNTVYMSDRIEYHLIFRELLSWFRQDSQEAKELYKKSKTP